MTRNNKSCRESDKYVKLVVHIGGHKTGSTSIQSTALANSHALRAIGVLYPAKCPYFRHEQHSYLALQIQRGDWKRVEHFLERAAHEARLVSAETVFLSGEEFWPLSARKVARFGKIASKYFSEKRIAYVTRSPEERLYSNFKHFLRHSSSRTIEQFIASTKRIFLPGNEIWLENFSPSCFVIDYHAEGPSLISGFFQKIFGIHIQEDVRENVSFDILSLFINNIFVKDWASQDTEDALWSYFQKHSGGNTFPIERAIREELVRGVFGNIEGETQPSSDTLKPDYDPIAVCDRMIDLFSELRVKFVARSQVPAQTSIAE